MKHKWECFSVMSGDFESRTLSCYTYKCANCGQLLVIHGAPISRKSPAEASNFIRPCDQEMVRKVIEE